MRLVLIIISVFICTFTFAQNDQINHCVTSSKLYKDYSNYIPDPEFPILTIKLNFVFLQRDNGCCGFTKSNPEHIDMVDRTMKFLNKTFSKLEDPESTECYSGEDFVNDTKIRFKLNEIIEIQDDEVWNMDKGGMCPNDNNWFINKVDTVIFKDPRYTNSINIYFPASLEGYTKIVEKRDSTFKSKFVNACSQLPSNKKLVRSSKLSMPNKSTKFFRMKNFVVNDKELNPKLHTWEGAIYYWFWSSMASGIAHELGHSLGLMHGNEHHGTNKCYSSIMCQKSKSKRNYLPPTEIGKIHRSMRMTNIRNFLAEDVYSPIPWVIRDDFNVDINYKVYEDIIVKSGVTLNVECHLEMSPKTSIILEPGAKLDLTNGTISGEKNKRWAGLIIQQNKKCFTKKGTVKTEDVINNISNLKDYLDIKLTKKKTTPK